jgi:hypothetical protein
MGLRRHADPDGRHADRAASALTVQSEELTVERLRRDRRRTLPQLRRKVR